MKANRWANPPYTLNIFRITFQVIQLETVIKVIAIIFQGPDNPTVRINLININLKRAYRVIHNFIYLIIILHYKYNIDILYMQINIDGPHKAQGHNPKGH